MSAIHKPWLHSLVLIFIIAGPCFSQDRRNSIEESAFRLLAGLDRESYDNQNARTAIARWYCEKGKYQEAAEQTATLDLDDRLSLLLYIAETAIDRKDQPSATKVLNMAWSALAKTNNDVETIWIAELAEVAACNQNFELAAKFVGRLEDGSPRKSRALLALASSYGELQNKKETVELVQTGLAQIDGFSEEERRDELQVKISAARVLTAIEEFDKAKDLAQQIQAALVSASEASFDDTARLASLFGDLGDLPRALAIVETLTGDERVGALIALSLHCKVPTIERSLLDRALDELLDASTNDYQSSVKISDVVPVFAQAGRIDDAVALLHRIKEPYQLHRAAIVVANVLADQQKVDDAEAVLNIAANVGRKIVSEKSEDIPSSASGSRALTKSQVISALSDAYIKIGRLSSAELAVDAIDHPQYRAIALSKIGAAYANQGDRTKGQRIFRKALALSDTSEEYSHDFSRVYALFSLIESAAEAGSPTDANNAMEQFLTLIKKNESGHDLVGQLFVLGKLYDSRGISPTKKVDALIKQIEAQQNGDN